MMCVALARAKIRSFFRSGKRLRHKVFGNGLQVLGNSSSADDADDADFSFVMLNVSEASSGMYRRFFASLRMTSGCGRSPFKNPCHPCHLRMKNTRAHKFPFAIYKNGVAEYKDTDFFVSL